MKYLTLVKYGVIAAVLIGIGAWLGGYPARLKYDRLQQEYSAFQIQVAHERQAAQKAATDALEAQIAARNATEERNAQVIRQLQARADTSAADLARANRLLELAAQDHPGGRAVPEATDQPGAAPTGETGSHESLAELLAAVKSECIWNADHWDAENAELAPQLH